MNDKNAAILLVALCLTTLSAWANPLFTGGWQGSTSDKNLKELGVARIDLSRKIVATSPKELRINDAYTILCEPGQEDMCAMAKEMFADLTKGKSSISAAVSSETSFTYEEDDLGMHITATCTLSGSDALECISTCKNTGLAHICPEEDTKTLFRRALL